jgi:hypothetical protein
MTETAAALADTEAVIKGIAEAYPGREGEVLAGILVHGLAHFVYGQDAASFVAALNTRLLEVAREHGARPYVLMRLDTATPPRH